MATGAAGASDDSRFWCPVPRRAVIGRVADCAPLIRTFCHAALVP